MSRNLPTVKYKYHPKMQEIVQQKERRKQILQKQRQRMRKQQQTIRKQKKQYFETSKQVIQQRKQDIYEKKLEQRNKVRQQEKQRQIRISQKRAQILQKRIPQRSEMIKQLKESYITYLKQKDEDRQNKIQNIMQIRLEEVSHQFRNIVPIQIRIREQNVIDINQRQCILCLCQEAQIYMIECKHLISCPNCEFMLRMQKKCPVCRKLGNYKNLNEVKQKRRFSMVK